MDRSYKGTASPADVLDRNLFLVGARPEDSDEDFSEDEGMSGQVVNDQRKLKKQSGEETDELDSLDQDLEDDEQDQDEEENENDSDEVDARDEDLDEEEVTYRKRYADTKADRDEKVRQLRELMTENARLKAVQSVTPSEIDEEALAREFQDHLYGEILKITETDPNKRSKAAYDIVGKHLAMSTKKAVELALKKVTDQQLQQQNQTDEQRRNLEVGKKRARIALKEVGLDPEKYYPNFESEVTQMLAEDPEWFNAIPPEQHYLRMAKRVKAAVKTIQEKRKDHQREAGGQLNAGSRVTKRSRQVADDDEDVKDTLTGAIQLLGRRNLARGNRAFELTHRR